MNTDRQHEAQQEIERVSKLYHANVTPGFDMNQLRLIKALGQGMNGAVSVRYSPENERYRSV